VLRQVLLSRIDTHKLESQSLDILSGMNENPLSKLSVEQLLLLFSQTLEELRRRDIIRSSNNPVGDYAENIAARALALDRVGKSAAGYDAISKSGERYQIKSRRITPHNPSRQLSFMRNIETKPFDYLVGVLFKESFEVSRACVMPFEVVKTIATFSKHVHAHRVILRDDVWDVPGVQDITSEVSRAASEICT